MKRIGTTPSGYPVYEPELINGRLVAQIIHGTGEVPFIVSLPEIETEWTFTAQPVGVINYTMSLTNYPLAGIISEKAVYAPAFSESGFFKLSGANTGIMFTRTLGAGNEIFTVFTIYKPGAKTGL